MAQDQGVRWETICFHLPGVLGVPGVLVSHTPGLPLCSNACIFLTKYQMPTSLTDPTPFLQSLGS